MVISTECAGSCKSNYHIITTTTAHDIFFTTEEKAPFIDEVVNLPFSLQIKYVCLFCLQTERAERFMDLQSFLLESNQYFGISGNSYLQGNMF